METRCLKCGCNDFSKYFTCKYCGFYDLFRAADASGEKKYFLTSQVNIVHKKKIKRNLFDILYSLILFATPLIIFLNPTWDNTNTQSQDTFWFVISFLIVLAHILINILSAFVERKISLKKINNNDFNLSKWFFYEIDNHSTTHKCHRFFHLFKKEMLGDNQFGLWRNNIINSFLFGNFAYFLCVNSVLNAILSTYGIALLQFISFVLCCFFLYAFFKYKKRRNLVNAILNCRSNVSTQESIPHKSIEDFDDWITKNSYKLIKLDVEEYLNKNNEELDPKTKFLLLYQLLNNKDKETLLINNLYKYNEEDTILDLLTSGGVNSLKKFIKNEDDID